MKIKKEAAIADDREKPLLFLDKDFPDRVIKTSFFLSLMAIVCSLSYKSFSLTLSVTIGCFISLILYKTLWWTIQHATQYKRTDIKVFFLKISLLKYFVVGTMLFLACLFLEVNIVAMALGLGIVLAVVVMKIGSRVLVTYLNRSIKVPFEKVN